MIQTIIIVVYFAITVAVGLYSMKKTKGSDSFHGVAMGMFAIVAASAGEWLGGTSTTGVSEYGFDYGLSGAWYTISNGIGTMFLALLFAKLYRSLNSVTVPGIIEKFFGVKARSVSSVLLTIVMLAVGLSQMIAAGKLGESLLGIPFVPAVIGFAVIFIIYTLAGGMNAVASTNKIHLFVMYGGAIVAVVFAVIKLGGLSDLMHWLDSSNMSQETQNAITAATAAGETVKITATSGGGFFGMLTIGFPKVSSWIVASLLGACTAQAGIQPVLAAKDVNTAKKAAIVTALVCAPFGLFTAFLGIISKALFNKGDLLITESQKLVNGKTALPTLMMNISDNKVVSGIVGGIVLASILAAILSTVSPIILSSGTMVTKDLYQRVFKPKATDKEVLFMSRLTTAISGVICTIGAIALVNLSAVLDIVYAAYSLRGALFIVVLFGIYWKIASEKAACISMLLTGVAAILWKVVDLVTGSYPIASWLTETYAAVIVAAVSTVVFSLIFPRKPEDRVNLKLAK
ncbi:MAG: sodium:solute symporter family protein [Oscillospiraceae bacterium]|jgi:SSS family solute:Na+ symporter|nr:sodium:solute symporter family protein [Oscillospiraceae bacterium]